MKEVDSDMAFAHWLRSAKRGERIMYYDGFLMRDKEIALRSVLSADYPPKIKAAGAAWKAFRDGLVALVQKKRGDFEYEYIAVKC